MYPRHRLRVLLALPHNIKWLNLNSLIQVCDGITKVGDARNGFEALSLCEYLQPDVVILGMSLPDIDGITVTQLLLQKPNPPQVIMLNVRLGEEDKQAALDAGVKAYFTQDATASEIISAICALHRIIQPN